MADELWLIGLVRAKTHPSTTNAVATFPTREGKIRYNVIIMEETNVLQSPVWADFQRRLGRNVITKKTKKYSYVAIVEKGAFSKRLYCPLGPIAGNLDGFQAALEDLKKEANKQKLDFVRVEPTNANFSAGDMAKLGLKKSRRDVQPPHSIVNDVSANKDKIAAELSQTARRYARKCDKAGITYRVSYEPTDIRYFIRLIHEVADRTGMHPMDDLYFQQIAGFMFPQKSAGLLLAELNGEVIAAIIFYTDIHAGGSTMMYTHAANSTKYRKYSPATGLGLYALNFAHDEGCKVFDWCGVAPKKDDGNPRWQSWRGFTHFKESYGGTRVDRIGTWELPLNHIKYNIYRLFLWLLHR